MKAKKPDHDPVGLFSPEICRHRIFTHVGRAIDGDNAENGQREHHQEEEPVEAEQFSQERSHVDLVGASRNRRDRHFRVYPTPKIRKAFPH